MPRSMPSHSTVYLASNAVNGKQYVGVTADYLSRRKSKHRYVALKGKSQVPFHRAIRFHGWESFSFTVLSVHPTYDEAMAEEVRQIAALRPEYNVTPGGGGYVGYKMSPAAVEKVRQANLGRPGYWKGKQIPTHVAQLTTERNLQPHRRKMWAKIRKAGPKASSRRVICLNDGREFDSAGAAAAAYGISNSQICSVCNRKPSRLMAKGLVFRYLVDHHGGKEEAAAVLASKAARLQAQVTEMLEKRGIAYAPR